MQVVDQNYFSKNYKYERKSIEEIGVSNKLLKIENDIEILENREKLYFESGKYDESIINLNRLLEIIRGPASYLEFRIQELTNLIKNKKHKIVNDFFNISPEKELIQRLITTYLKFKKAEKQRISARKLKKEFRKIEDELENKIGEELMENIQLILKDCEELVGWESELEERLKVKTLLI